MPKLNELITFRITHSQAKCIVMTAVCLSVSVCVCLSLVALLHYCTDQDVILGNDRGALCALEGGFAVGAQVSFLWQHTRLMRNVSEDGRTRSMAGV